ncbi:MAG TPA: DASS family sodium-coupled anion symporter [Candidatus Acidoferrales bacterium]|nr:DASS family sodium-coupled anion symporter [Candidatus Acidoferrales bacterium]
MTAAAENTSAVRIPAQGAWWRWAVVLIPGALLYFFPLPGLNPAQARVFGVFVATVIALVAQPVRMGVSVLLAMTLLALTGTLSPARVLSGFANVTVWLIFTAFLFSRAVTQTGFGMRVGYLFIERFARTPLRLGYSMAAADLVLAPFIPSDTARGGGVVFPITRSVARAFGSEPGPSARLMGSFLVLVSFHTTYTASAMFLTGMASNPLIADFARNIGRVELTWLRWFTGSCVPGSLALLVVPWLLLRLVKPEIRETGPARELARRELAHMGPLRRDERWLVAIMSGVMAGWVTSPLHGIPNTFVALTGVCALLLARVISWDDLLDERRAWDTLIWFAPIIMMSDVMTENGAIRVLSGHLFRLMAGWAWPAVLAAVVLSYCYVHYGFASMTAQVTALYPAFLGAALAGGVPPMTAALALAYFSNLNAAMTHYGTGSAPVFFGAGYVRQGEWWRIGFLISLVQAAIWLGIGSLWWSVAGLR